MQPRELNVTSFCVLRMGIADEILGYLSNGEHVHSLVDSLVRDALTYYPGVLDIRSASAEVFFVKLSHYHNQRLDPDIASDSRRISAPRDVLPTPPSSSFSSSVTLPKGSGESANFGNRTSH